MPAANYLDIEQGTKAWFDARLGCVTSSRVADATRFLKRRSGEKQVGDSSEGREKLKIELVYERLTKCPSPHYVSEWMEYGKDNEPLARAAYEIYMKESTEQVGFVFHPEIKMAGASPDALIGDEGMAEFKCPKFSTHIRYLHEGVIPPQYQPQMLWQLACDPQRKWNDFVSYAPPIQDEHGRTVKLPEKMRIFVARMERPNNLIAATEELVSKFLAEVDVMESLLRDKYEAYEGESYIERQLKSSLRARGVEPELGVTLEDCVG